MSGRGNTRRNLVIASVVVLAAIVAVGVAIALRSDDRSSEQSTGSPDVDVVIAPLTGMSVDRDDSAALERLDRPALVAMIDNAPVAMPQIGIEGADVVIEVQVEGISRYMAVVHSQPVAELGPVRSARTSVPDLLAMFGRPMLAWSGGNPAVTELIDSTPWIQSLTPNSAGDAFSRSSDRSAPHNLILDVGVAESMADQPPSIPTELFSYLAAGDAPGGVPVAGFDLSVGFSLLGFDWDAAAGSWVRRANDRPHLDVNGEQLRATNVVVLETAYEPSPADADSPEAQSLGEGAAWVFTDGRMIEGRWDRTESTEPWRLRTVEGEPIRLTPGNTWVELPTPGVAPTLTGSG